jgi:hypothetical protein
MYRNAKDVGYCPRNLSRFSVLNDLKFSSVLDVGSGPCILKDVLRDVIYEAMDIRKESLALCNCKTYTSIPDGNKYDLVCFFGVFTHGDKQQHRELLEKGVRCSNKYVVFSTIKPFSISGNILTYDENEVLQMISLIKPTGYTIDTTTEPTETIVVCEI